MKIHYAGTPGTGYGWGVCNENLIRELGKQVVIYRPGTEPNPIDRDVDVVFMPLADHDFSPITPRRAKVNLAYTFFESPLGPNAAHNAARYDVVFAGSTWCLERMKERGIANGRLLIQGVDHDIFKPQPMRKPDGQFRIFSGGKFEYRKGQDLVIAAFKEFSRRRENAHLVCSWFNPWPQLIRSMAQPGNVIGLSLIDLPKEVLDLAWSNATPRDQCEMFQGYIGFDRTESVTILPSLSQPDLANEMANTDVGLFPNRCEGGTNLVLMEYASCGRRVIANTLTGHSDVTEAISYRIQAEEDENHWAVQSVEDIVGELEFAYACRSIPPHWSESAHRQWTWEAAAKKIVDTARSFLEAPQSQPAIHPSLIDLASTAGKQ